MIGHLFLAILPLAFAAAISPTLLTLTVLILTSSHRPVARALSFAFGAEGVLLGFGVVEMYVLRGVAAQHPSSPLFHWIDVVFGIILVGLALRGLLRSPKPKKERKPEGAQWGLPRYVGLGMAGMAANITTLVIYIPLAKEIARTPIGVASQLGVLLAANVIIMLPVLIPLGIRVLLPGPSTHLLASLDAWVTKNGRKMGGVLILAIGLLLIYRGVRGL